MVPHPPARGPEEWLPWLSAGSTKAGPELAEEPLPYPSPSPPGAGSAFTAVRRAANALFPLPNSQDIRVEPRTSFQSGSEVYLSPLSRAEDKEQSHE